MNKKNEIICKNCHQPLFHKKDGKLKIRTNIIVFEKGEEDDFNNALIKCPVCKTDNTVPIVLDVRTKNTEIGHYIFEK